MDVLSETQKLIEIKMGQLNLDERTQVRLARLLSDVGPRCGVRGSALGKLFESLARCHPDLDQKRLSAFAELEEPDSAQSYHLNHLNMAVLLVASSLPVHYERGIPQVMAQATAMLLTERPLSPRAKEGVDALLEEACAYYREFFTFGRLQVQRREGRRVEFVLTTGGSSPAFLALMVRGLLEAWFARHDRRLESSRSTWSSDADAFIEIVWQVDPARYAR